MNCFLRSPARSVVAAAFAASALCVTERSSAQSSAAFPEPAPTPAPAPAPAQPAPAPAATTQGPPPAAPAAAVQPAPAPGPPPPPPAYAAPAYPADPGPGYAEPPLPPPPPERPESDGFEMPPFSVRVDPFLWLLDGKFALELEVGLTKFLSVELVPLFVVNEQPPTFNYFTGRDDPLSRESDGIGPLAGTSVGLGFWLSGKPLQGTVLRGIFTNYAYHYVAADEQGEFDNVSHVERHLLAYIGSHSKWGVFTLAGGFGIGADLNHEERCFVNDPPDYPATTQGCDGDLLIKASRNADYVANLNSGLGSVVLLFRFSLGVAFD
ncbi:MAG TPA: hypothetical protein VFZ53_33480 [Polyangiaceae bacterium]